MKLLFFLVLSGLFCLAGTTEPVAAAPTAPSADAQLKGAESQRSQDEAIRQQMVTISRQLGVTCNACHNPKNFSSDAKLDFKIAKGHMKITQLLIDHGFDGQDKRPKADCYMCHRGTLKPDYIEKFDPMTMEKLKHK